MPSGARSRSAKKSGHSLPPFLENLWTMLEDPTTDKVFAWSEASSNSFVVKNTKEFEKILGKYFKHQKFASFVRQLNMYDFYKVRDARAGPTWSHPCLKKGQKRLLFQIKRKNAHEDVTKRAPKMPQSDSSNNDRINRLTTTVENHEERIDELESELEYAKRVQRAMQKEMEKAIKNIYGMISVFTGTKHRGSTPRQPCTTAPKLLKENSGNERSAKRARKKSGLGEMVIYNSGPPFPGFPGKSDPKPKTPVPRLEIPPFKLDTPMIMPANEHSGPDQDLNAMDVRLSPKLDPTPPWKFPFSPHAVEDGAGEFSLDFNPFSEHQPLSTPHTAPPEIHYNDDDTIMSDTTAHGSHGSHGQSTTTKVEPSVENEQQHNDPSTPSSLSLLHNDRKLSDEYVAEAPLFPELRHSFSNSEEDVKPFLKTPPLRTTFKTEPDENDDQRQNDASRLGNSHQNHSSMNHSSTNHSSMNHSSTNHSSMNHSSLDMSSSKPSPIDLPPATLSFTSEQILYSPGLKNQYAQPSTKFSTSHISPTPTDNKRHHTPPYFKSQSDQKDTQSSLNKNPFSNGSSFSDPFRGPGTDPSTSPLSSTVTPMFDNFGSSSNHSQSTHSGNYLHSNSPPSNIADDEFKEKDLSNRFQTIHISPGESDGNVQQAETLIQQLLSVVANVYAQKGAQGLFPGNYEGFGCWFTNLKSSPDVSQAQHLQHAPPPPPPPPQIPLNKPPKEPWAMLLYGVKDLKPPAPAVMG